MSASVNPRGSDTYYKFAYGPTTDYGVETPGQRITASSPEQLVSETVAGLIPNTTYHFKVMATNAVGSTSGADQVFVTQAAPARQHYPVTVQADPGSGVRGRMMKLTYEITYIESDTSTYEVLTVGTHRIRTPAHHRKGVVVVKWRVPKNARRQMKFCVTSFERSPFSGVSRDCAPIFIS